MTFPSQAEIDIIATQILLDAKQAILGLQAFSKFTKESEERLRVLKRIVSSVAAQMNGDFRKAEMAVKRFSGAITGIKTEEIRMAANLAKQTNMALSESGDAAHKGISRALTAVNALRIALGVLVSMLIFQVIQAFQSVFRTMIENVREAELAVYNLINAERNLSNLGIEITPKDLQDIIDKVRELVPILSQIQAEELVSRISQNVAPSLRLTREEIEKMSKAVALAYIQNKALGYSFDEIEKSITESSLTGKVSQGVNKYGVKITDLIIKQHAVNMELVDSVELLDKLDAEAQAQIKGKAFIDYAFQEFSKNAEAIPEYMKTTDAAIEGTEKAWSDLMTLLGTYFGPLLAKFLTLVRQFLEGWTMAFEHLKPIIVDFFSTWVAFLMLIEELIRNPLMSWGELADKLAQFKNEAVSRAMQTLATSADNATNVIKDVYRAAADDGEAAKALDDLDEKIQDIILDAKQAQENLDIKLQQKQADLDTEYQRKEADAARQHAQKLSDINQDAQEKIADAKRKAREDERKAEQDLLQKLKELRDRFLMDLEEALHKRDARQVLRLIKEYKMEKQHILERKKLDSQQRKDKLAEDLKAIEIERQRRIESENIEYQRKLADLALAKAREQEELQLWYKREQEDIQRNIEQKLEKLLAGYITEEKLHEEHQAKIFAILSKYFGKDAALMSQLSQFMAQQFAQIQGMQVAAIAIPQTFKGLASQAANAWSTAKGFAEGGTLVADKPTTVTFGERGMEAATFTPLNRTGHDVNKVFGDIGGTGVNGQITVAVDLSPDLEGRIIQRSMDGVANVVTRVNNRKAR